MDATVGEIIIYQSEDGHPSIDVHLKDETVWLTQKQISSLFETERSVVTKHINNVFRTGELARNSVCAKFAHTAGDGKVYQIIFYNLDMIIAVGYRVNAKRGTQFRIWATSVLKDHLVRGYSLEHGAYFGQERNESLAGIIGAVQQTFDGRDLYPGVEEKAAHLLYFVIKDHPFTDGNKRIGAFLFLLYLDMNGLLDKGSFDNKALVALALLTAAGDPARKDLIIRLIVNLLSETDTAR